jgi:hypothetical protein
MHPDRSGEDAGMHDYCEMNPTKFFYGARPLARSDFRPKFSKSEWRGEVLY